MDHKGANISILKMILDFNTACIACGPIYLHGATALVFKYREHFNIERLSWHHDI